jgi:hypothetical protein
VDGILLLENVDFIISLFHVNLLQNGKLEFLPFCVKYDQNVVSHLMYQKENSQSNRIASRTATRAGRAWLRFGLRIAECQTS